MQPGKHFEDYQVGEKFTTWGRTITEADVIQFVAFTGFNEPLFLDREYLKTQPVFPAPVVPGIQVLCYAEGLVAQTGLLHGTGLAFMGVDGLRVKAPTLVGDTITVEVLVKTLEPGRRADGGRVTYHHVVRNQKQDVVMEFDVTRLIRKRSA